MMLPKASIQTLKPYRTKSLPYKIKLDANEATRIVLSDFVSAIPQDLFRYPDNYAVKLREIAAKYYGVETEHIIAGNGSSEMIELIMKTYIDTNDTILGFNPSFSMYEVFSRIYAANYIRINTDEDFTLDAQSIINAAKTHNPKAIFLCTPNNPTGKIISVADIKRILSQTHALVVVDEAYIEFYDQTETMLKYLNTYDNLIVLRTVSKALGLAGLRLGFLCSNKAIVDTLNMVKAPYNLNSLTQAFGIHAFNEITRADHYLETIKLEREWIYAALKDLGIKVYASKANFLFFKSAINNLYDKLLNEGILIRKFSGELSGYYRVSIGTKDENRCFIETLKEVVNNA